MKKKLLSLSIAGLFTCSIRAQIITTIAGTGTAGYSGDGGQALSAKLMYPSGLAVDKSGNVYIADYSSNTVRKINSLGTISTLAGNNTQGNAGDGGQATAANLYDPTGIALDPYGNIYIADDDNNKIRKVDNTGKINTYAGDGFVGYYGDNVLATTARLSSPWGITVDKHSNVYFADLSNQRIRKIDSLGVITTIAGTGTAGYSGDGGQATAAELNYPANVALDVSGNLYIADRANNVIRMIHTTGVITTVAGNNTQGYSGDGGQATLAELGLPFGIDVDKQGNIYVADQVNNVIRKINTSGIISTVVGTGTQGYSGDGSDASLAELNLPRDVKVDTAGNLYIADSNNSRIRKVSAAQTTGIEKALATQAFKNLYPNPSRGSFVIEPNSTNKQTIHIYDVNGNLVLSQPISGKTTIDASSLQEGIYNISIISSEGTLNKKLIILR